MIKKHRVPCKGLILKTDDVSPYQHILKNNKYASTQNLVAITNMSEQTIKTLTKYLSGFQRSGSVPVWMPPIKLVLFTSVLMGNFFVKSLCSL